MKRVAAHWRGAFCALTVITCFSTAGAAEELYRYKNAEGITVIGYHVPPELMAGGYEVINEDGVVLSVVPREMSTEEKAAWTDRQEREAAAQEEAERLRKWDESLLLRYSSVEDIEAARERALRELRMRLSILRSNKRSLRSQIESYQAQAADQERMGHEVGVELEQAIEELQQRVASEDRSIVDREREIEEVEAAFQSDIERFKQLQHLVEWRRANTPRS